MTVKELTTEYQVGDLKYSSSLDEDLFVDRFNLSQEFEKHASRFAWYSTCYELAIDYENRVKTELERAYANLDSTFRKQMEQLGLKFTEKKIEGLVLTHATYIQLQDALNEAKLQTGLLKAAKDAMIMKKDCLISLGANQRAELASDPSLLTAAYLQSKRDKETTK